MFELADKGGGGGLFQKDEIAGAKAQRQERTWCGQEIYLPVSIQKPKDPAYIQG